MISFFSSWIETVAISVIIASLFEIILPNGNIKKYIKIILGIYIVFAIISPFVDSNALYNFNINKTIDEYTNKLDKKVSKNDQTQDIERMYLDTLKKEIITIIEKQGYNVHSCKIDADFDTDNENIGINKLNIVLDSKNSNYKDSENTTDFNNINENTIKDIETIEKVDININNDNTNEIYSSKEISKKDIKELKEYLSDYYNIKEKIINIQKN